MSGSFDASGLLSYILMSAGSAGAVGSGGYTMAVLCQPATGNNNAGFLSGMVSGANNREIFEDTNVLFGDGDFSSGFGTLTQGTWYLIAQSKASGSNTYRHHIWAYAAAGTGTMTHGVASGSGTHGDGSAINQIRIGGNSVKGNGLIAVVGLWDRALSDAELDSMKSGALTAWRDVSGGQPKELISLESWNGSTGSTAVIGTSTQSSITGTVNSGANPPSFNFALGGGSTATDVPDTGGLGMAALSSGGAAVTGVLAASDSGIGARLRSPNNEVVLTGTLATADSGLGAGLRSANGAGILTGINFVDLPGWSAVRSSDGAGAGSGVSTTDAPGFFRFGSASEIVAFGVGVPDSGLGIRLGAPSAAVVTGLVVSDTPGGLRTGSGQSSVAIGSLVPVMVADLPGWMRLGAPGASVVITQASALLPILAPVQRLAVTAPVARTAIVAPVHPAGYGS